MSLNHDAFSHPLPKLRLCGPKFLAVAADHQRCFLLFCLFLLLFFGIHFFTRSVSTPVALHVLRICIRKWSHTSTPWGNLYGEAASGCQRIRNFEFRISDLLSLRFQLGRSNAGVGLPMNIVWTETRNPNSQSEILFRNFRYMSNRDINSARLLTPNLMKICRR